MNALDEIVAKIPPEIRRASRLQFYIGQRIQSIIENRGWNKTHLRGKLKTSMDYVEQLLNGEVSLTLAEIARLEVLLNEDIIFVEGSHEYEDDQCIPNQ